jgi:hypothetical protein
MEQIMSKTNDTAKLGHAKLEKRVLADSELDAVSGGWSLLSWGTGGGSGGGGGGFRELAMLLGEIEQKKFR